METQSERENKRPDASGALPGAVVEAVALAGASGVGLQPSTLADIQLSNLVQNTNQAAENEVSFQQTQNGIQATALGKVVNMLTTLGPLQSMSATQLLTGNAVAEEIGGLKGTLAAFSGGGRRKKGELQPGEAGFSAVSAITSGTVRLNPPSGETINLIITNVAPKQPAAAPQGEILAGDVYVYDGPQTVNVVIESDNGNIQITRL